ncbi:hypothetical protein [Actinomadura sp. B10D3]|uniref:hypothetical protein n=1 Tax=Actinomadura sp. B10D3 TaxID=3153557 RepID=UPI00325C45EC
MTLSISASRGTGKDEIRASFDRARRALLRRARITLVDTVGGKRYFPLIGAGGECLCSDTLNSIVQPGRSAEFYAVVPAPPPEVKRISVSVPQTRVFPDVPIGEGPVRPPGGTDPAGAGRPKILPLISTAEGGDRAVDDGDGTRSVRLSSDVLFAVDRADLSAKAPAVLADVARQIDRAAGATVRIDGHTDDTGDDAINFSQPPVARPDGGSRPAARTNPVSPPRPEAPEVRSLKLDVTELRRSPPGLVNLVWKLTNTDGEPFTSTTRFTLPVTKVFYYGGASDGTMGVTLYDEATGMRYYTLRDTQNRCVCNQPTGRDYRVLPGGTITHANAYRLPPEVTNITVEFPGYEPTRSVPVS